MKRYWVNKVKDEFIRSCNLWNGIVNHRKDDVDVKKRTGKIKVRNENLNTVGMILLYDVFDGDTLHGIERVAFADRAFLLRPLDTSPRGGRGFYFGGVFLLSRRSSPSVLWSTFSFGRQCRSLFRFRRGPYHFVDAFDFLAA